MKWGLYALFFVYLALWIATFILLAILVTSDGFSEFIELASLQCKEWMELWRASLR